MIIIYFRDVGIPINEIGIRGVYLIENKENGKVYVGSSNNILERIDSHYSQLKHGRHPSKDMQIDYNNAKSEKSFVVSIIESIQDENEEYLRTLEQYYISRFRAIDVGYNSSSSRSIRCEDKNLLKHVDKNVKKCSVYQRFFELYDSKIFKFGEKFLWKVANREYEPIHINAINKIMEWYYNTFWKERPSCIIRFEKRQRIVDIIYTSRKEVSTYIVRGSEYILCA